MIVAANPVDTCPQKMQSGVFLESKSARTDFLVVARLKKHLDIRRVAVPEGRNHSCSPPSAFCLYRSCIHHLCLVLLLFIKSRLLASLFATMDIASILQFPVDETSPRTRRSSDMSTSTSPLWCFVNSSTQESPRQPNMSTLPTKAAVGRTHIHVL